MCYNYGYDMDEYKLKRLSGPRLKKYLDNLDPDLPRRIYQANGFAHPYMPVITADNPDSIQFFKWGYVPRYDDGKDPLKTMRRWNSTLNCRSETMFEKISFKNEAKSGQRCLILTDGILSLIRGEKINIPIIFSGKTNRTFL